MGQIGYADSDGNSATLCDGQNCNCGSHVQHNLGQTTP